MAKDNVCNTSMKTIMNGHHDEMKEPNAEDSYVIGDLLWSKISGHPHWPCMVTYDPLQGCYSKEKFARGRSYTIYHVQYFGEAAQRGWTVLGGILPFEGYSQFTARIAHLREKALKNQQKHINEKFSITPSKQKVRQVAVDEAEIALPMTRKKRLEAFTFHYRDIPKKYSYTNGFQHVNGDVVENTEGDSTKKLNLSKNSKKESSESISLDFLCQICEKTGANITCNGVCAQSYHMTCLGMLVAPLDFKCSECASGKNICFVCKMFDSFVKKCSKSDCGKFYHPECMKKFPCANADHNICSLHKCLTCYNDNPKNPSSCKARLVKCFRCPIAYHSRDGCTAAGSEILNSNFVLCPEHFSPMKGRQYQTVCN